MKMETYRFVAARNKRGVFLAFNCIKNTFTVEHNLLHEIVRRFRAPINLLFLIGL